VTHRTIPKYLLNIARITLWLVLRVRYSRLERDTHEILTQRGDQPFPSGDIVIASKVTCSVFQLITGREHEGNFSVFLRWFRCVTLKDVYDFVTVGHDVL